MQLSFLIKTQDILIRMVTSVWGLIIMEGGGHGEGGPGNSGNSGKLSGSSERK